jgi:hypothetical protein
VVELNPHRRIREAADVGQETRERGFVGIGIEAEALRRDASNGADRRGFQDHESRAGDGETAEVHPMPGLRGSLKGAVLAQGRDDDAIPKSEVA